MSVRINEKVPYSESGVRHCLPCALAAGLVVEVEEVEGDGGRT